MKQSYKQSARDPCLFIHAHVIGLVYVDACLFFSPSMTYIDETIQKLKSADLNMTKEDDVAGF